MDRGRAVQGHPLPLPGLPPPGGPPLGHAFPARRRWGERHWWGGEGRGSARLSGRAARREMGGGGRAAAGSKSKRPGQTQDPARGCPLRFRIVRGDCRPALLREAAGSGEPWPRRWASPLFSPPPLLLPPPLAFSLLPFTPPFSWAYLPGHWWPLLHHECRAAAGAGLGGLVWARSQVS